MPDQQQPTQDIPEPPKSVAAASPDYEGGVAGHLGGDKTQTAQTQQPAAAPAAQPKKKPTYDGPGLQRPASSGFMQQLTGVVNQGKNLMRSDINARMGAWHDATQHPERASEFLKAQPLTPFKGVKDIAEDGRKEMYEATGNADLANAEYAETLNDPYAAIIALRNKQAALETDADNDKEREKKRIWNRDLGSVMNRIGTEKPREKATIPYTDEEIKEMFDGAALSPEERADLEDWTEIPMHNGPTTRGKYAAERIRNPPSSVTWDELMGDGSSVDFKESATLLDGYLDGLQDRGYITRDQKEFTKAQPLVPFDNKDSPYLFDEINVPTDYYGGRMKVTEDLAHDATKKMWDNVDSAPSAEADEAMAAHDAMAEKIWNTKAPEAVQAYRNKQAAMKGKSGSAELLKDLSEEDKELIVDLVNSGYTLEEAIALRF